MRYAPSRARSGGLVLACSLLLAVTTAPFSTSNAQTNTGKGARSATIAQSDFPGFGAPSLNLDASPAEKPAVKPVSFDMSAVEQMRLRVPDNADLSGGYRVDADASISLPGLGRVRAGGLSPEAFERELSKKVSLFVRRDLTVSVEIEQFKPYFIIGMVADPGASEWRPGLNILKAVALARGTIRSPSAADDPVTALATRQSQTQLQFSLALLARLKAERDGSASVEPAEHTAAIIASMPASIQPRLNEFLARQSAVLDEQRELLARQVAGFERDRQAAGSELEVAQQQEQAVKSQLDISQSLLTDVEHLKDQKLVSNSRYLSQRSDLINSQIRHGEAQSLMERARARLEAVARQIETLQRERKTALNERIEILQREVAQLEVNLLPVNVGSEPQLNGSNLVYHIARETATGITTIDATVFSDVFPGDVVVVSVTVPENAVTAADRRQQSAEVTGSAGDRIQRALEASSAAPAGSAGRGASRGAAASGGGAARTGVGNARPR